ncbi:MAG: ABC transporter permease [Deltaproteobacteria bacterium]|nr:ABC transporter permease [Deltaproteobacteria bacterium]
MLGPMLRLALQAIRRNVLRSSLTVLGIVIGVASVIIMVTLGAGATQRVTNDLQKLGTNTLMVRPGQSFHGGGGARGMAAMLKVEDAEAIEREIAGVAAVAPMSQQQMQAIAGSQNRSTSVIGSTASYLAVRNWAVSSGRAFSDAEERAGKAVCLLGDTVRRELFGAQSPLGQRVRLGQLSCAVIGVLEAKGESAFGSDQDDFVLVPLRWYHRRVAGNTDVGTIHLAALPGVSTSTVQRDTERLMRERRRTGNGDDDFSVRDMKEIVSAFTTTTRVLTGLLGAVAAVSLIVGGIGIMNIMLVSVTERTREIGIRLAIGALEREVLTQFLVEAVVLSSLGGVVGIGLGLAAAAGGAGALGVPFVPEPSVVLLAFAFSAAIGVAFGYWPAQQAARLDPIEALRHE